MKIYITLFCLAFILCISCDELPDCDQCHCKIVDTVLYDKHLKHLDEIYTVSKDQEFKRGLEYIYNKYQHSLNFRKHEHFYIDLMDYSDAVVLKLICVMTYEFNHVGYHGNNNIGVQLDKKKKFVVATTHRMKEEMVKNKNILVEWVCDEKW